MAANLTVDREGKVTAWNAEAAELLGYSAAQAIGRVMDFSFRRNTTPTIGRVPARDRERDPEIHFIRRAAGRDDLFERHAVPDRRHH